MKRFFITIISIFVLAIGIIAGISMLDNDSYVKKGQATVLEGSGWDTVWASYVNSKGISIVAGDIHREAVMLREAYMNENKELMLSEDLLREVFDCAVDIYEDNRLVLSAGGIKAQYIPGESVITVTSPENTAGSRIPVENLPEETEDGMFIPAEMLKKGLGFSYVWNEDSMTAVFSNETADIDNIHYYYSNAEYGRLTDIKNQENLGVCWAFASISALENSLLPEETWDFSEDHMIYNNPSGTGDSEGGDFLSALSYLTSWSGPVKEEDDPFNDGATDAALEAVKHVQEVRFLENKDYETIKKMVFKYGAVETSVHIVLEEENYVSPEYYDYTTFGYCYDGKADANHEVVIVGWDDNFPAEKLGGHAENDGAFICKNSWGSSFGDNGVFYVAYDDAVIGRKSEVYTRIDDADNYDNIYQWDSAGWNGSIGYGRNRAYAASVFTARRDESLRAVSLVATGANTSYKIYICRDFKNVRSLKMTGEPAAQGVFTQAGYYTVDLENTVDLEEGDRFAVIAEIITTGSSRPVAVNIPVNRKGIREGEASGESYISNFGDDWESTQEVNNCTVCMKVFTDYR